MGNHRCAVNKRGIVELSPHNPEWKKFYQKEKNLLQNTVGEHILEIQHVGSTSISGIIAKAIIDIAVAVRDFDEAKVCVKPIEGLGYEYRGEYGIERRHYFVKGQPRTHHLHMLEATSRDYKNHLLFRDYLNKHQETAREYEQLKMELAEKSKTDREAFQEGKSPFIEQVLKLAEQEYYSQGK